MMFFAAALARGAYLALPLTIRAMDDDGPDAKTAADKSADKSAGKTR
jgi:hypothetical protein